LLFSGETVLAYEHFARSHSPRIDFRHCLHFHQLVLDGISFPPLPTRHTRNLAAGRTPQLRTLQSGTGLSAIAISALYVLVARFQVGFFADGMVGALRFAALIWIALSAPVAIEAAIYVRMHSMVVLGQVIDWLTTTILACAITFLWITA